MIRICFTKITLFSIEKEEMGQRVWNFSPYEMQDHRGLLGPGSPDLLPLGGTCDIPVVLMVDRGRLG